MIEFTGPNPLDDFDEDEYDTMECKLAVERSNKKHIRMSQEASTYIWEISNNGKFVPIHFSCLETFDREYMILK